MESAYAATTRRFFVFGGVNSLGDVWQFDVGTRRWTALEDRSAPLNVVRYGADATSLPPGRSSGFMFVSNEATSELTVVGGVTTDSGYSGALMDIWRYQPICPRPITIAGESLCISCNRTLVLDCQATPLPCAAGYQSDANGWFCTICPVGTYKNFGGPEACPSCPEGSICNSTTVIACQKGYEWNNNLPCTACSSGFYQPFTGVQMCMACVPGSDCNSTSTICPAGYSFNTTALTCDRCIETITYKLSSGNFDCTNCPANTLCGTTNYFCLPGKYWNGTACTSCDRATYKTAPGNDSSCSACPDNAICDGTNYQCAAGFRLVGRDCVQCDGNRYKTKPGNETCTACPFGAVCTSFNYRCDIGFTLNSTTLQCQLCPIDQFKDLTGNESCTFCEPQKKRLPTRCYCEFGTDWSTGQCNPAPLVVTTTLKLDTTTSAGSLSVTTETVNGSSSVTVAVSTNVDTSTIVTTATVEASTIVTAPAATVELSNIATAPAPTVETSSIATASAAAVDTSKIATASALVAGSSASTSSNSWSTSNVARQTTDRIPPLTSIDNFIVIGTQIVAAPTQTSEPTQTTDVSDLSKLFNNPIMLSSIGVTVAVVLVLIVVIIRCIMRQRSRLPGYVDSSVKGAEVSQSFDALNSAPANGFQSSQAALTGTLVNSTLVSDGDAGLIFSFKVLFDIISFLLSWLLGIHRSETLRTNSKDRRWWYG